MTPEQLITAWCEDPEPIRISIDRKTAYTLAALLQLALRHPDVGVLVREIGEHVVSQLQTRMPEEIAELSRQGDDRTKDVPR